MPEESKRENGKFHIADLAVYIITILLIGMTSYYFYFIQKRQELMMDNMDKIPEELVFKESEPISTKYYKMELIRLNKLIGHSTGSMISMISVRYVAMILGITMIFLGALMIIRGIRELSTDAQGKVGKELSFKIVSSSPGVIFSFFGTLIVVVAILKDTTSAINANGLSHLAPNLNSSVSSDNLARPESIELESFKNSLKEMGSIMDSLENLGKVDSRNLILDIIKDTRNELMIVNEKLESIKGQSFMNYASYAQLFPIRLNNRYFDSKRGINLLYQVGSINSEYVNNENKTTNELPDLFKLKNVSLGYRFNGRLVTNPIGFQSQLDPNWDAYFSRYPRVFAEANVLTSSLSTFTTRSLTYGIIVSF